VFVKTLLGHPPAAVPRTAAARWTSVRAAAELPAVTLSYDERRAIRRLVHQEKRRRIGMSPSLVVASPVERVADEIVVLLRRETPLTRGQIFERLPGRSRRSIVRATQALLNAKRCTVERPFHASPTYSLVKR